MDKLKVLMKYAGISVFEYFPDSDRMVLYDEQLEEERRNACHFLDELDQNCVPIHPEDVQEDCVSFFSDRTSGNRGTGSCWKTVTTG
ncbi:MAG: hypothetical protein ACLSHW_07840 [Lachnospiraceae bacterium]